MAFYSNARRKNVFLVLVLLVCLFVFFKCLSSETFAIVVRSGYRSAVGQFTNNVNYCFVFSSVLSMKPFNLSSTLSSERSLAV